MKVTEWLDNYRRIWVEHDGSRELLERLFTDDAQLRPRVLAALEQPYVGIDVIHDYIVRVLPDVDIESMEFARPIRDGNRVAVETWLYGSIFGKRVTEAMCTVLRLDRDGRCYDLRDYPQSADGVERPYAEWADLD